MAQHRPTQTIEEMQTEFDLALAALDITFAATKKKFAEVEELIGGGRI